MSSGSACVSKEFLLQDFCARIGLKKKSMFTADGRAPPETHTPEGYPGFSFRQDCNRTERPQWFPMITL